MSLHRFHPSTWDPSAGEHAAMDADGSGAVLAMERGIPGFPELAEILLTTVDDYGIFVWLSATQRDEVAFLAVNPFVYFPDYNVDLDDADEEGLDVEADDDLIVYCLVSIDRERREATTNLLAPIVLNVTKALASQVILETDYSLRAPLPVPAETPPATSNRRELGGTEAAL